MPAISSVVAFYASASARGLHESVAVMATGTAANIVGIGAAQLFSATQPALSFGIAIQALAFVLITVAAALVAGPLHAAGAAGRSRRSSRSS